MTKNRTVTIDVQAVYDRAVAALEPAYTLNYVAYDERLHDEQIHRIFQGDLEGVETEIVDRAADNPYYEEQTVTELVKDPVELAALRQSDLYWPLIEEIKERDNSDLFGDLVRNTGQWSTLMRYRLGSENPDLEPCTGRPADIGDQLVTRHAKRLAKLAGVEFLDNAQAFRQMVTEQAWHGGYLCVIWYGNPAPLIEAVCEDLWHNPKPRRRIIEFTNPELLLLDSWNGSGYGERIKGTVRKVWDPARCVVDSQDGPYGWDKIAGVVHSAYRCDVTISPSAKRPSDG